MSRCTMAGLRRRMCASRSSGTSTQLSPVVVGTFIVGCGSYTMPLSVGVYHRTW